MKYNQEIIQQLASYIDLQDVKAFIENKNKLFNIGSFVTVIVIATRSDIEYIKI